MILRGAHITCASLDLFLRHRAEMLRHTHADAGKSDDQDQEYGEELLHGCLSTNDLPNVAVPTQRHQNFRPEVHHA